MKRNKFSLSHYKLLSCKFGSLVPIACLEVLPGDTLQHSCSALIRVSPLVAPVMHPVHARIHHWFVPYRLLWDGTSAGDNWEDFITGGPDGLNAAVPPYVLYSAATAPSVGSLSDYFGIPTNAPTGANQLRHSVLPFRAYQMIWNEWYRDQDLETAAAIAKTGNQDSTTSLAMKNVAWEKDYFTTSRPWTQKGPVVSLPLTGNAPVTGIGALEGSGINANPTGQIRTTTASGDFSTGPASSTSTANAWQVKMSSGGGGVVSTTNRPSIYADLSAVTAATINDLRLAMALQRYEEARARYGSRYVEYLRYLGVRSSDARLQRPEYLGGGKQTIQFSEVLQTGVTTSGTPGTGVGIMRGHGIGAMRSNRYRRFFEEHGVVISLLSLKPRTMYSQGLHKSWRRTVKEDWWQRELQHIGQQQVYNREVYQPHATPDGVFGYQDRYDEYRRAESSVAGQFRTTLNYWHLAREFASDPALNATFVSSNPSNRVFADQTNDQFYVMASHSIQARRMVSSQGTSFTF